MADPQKLLSVVERSNLMTPRQREITQRDIRTLERALHGQPMPYYGGDPVASGYEPSIGSPSQGTVLVLRDQPVPDRELLEKNHAACQETLKQGTAPPLSGAAKNTLYATYKADCEAYQVGMPSHEQMWKPTWHNVQIYMQHREANLRRAKRIQNIHRILEPDDDVFHVEALRPEKPTPFNGRAFRAGYTNVQWTDAKELELQVQELDDETYYQFLQLKARGVESQKLFQDKLHLTPQQYAACVARLQASALDADVDATPEPSVVPPPAEDASPALSSLVEELTEGEDSAVQTYGDALLAVLGENGPLTEQAALAVVQSLTPEAFHHKAGKAHAMNKARAAIQGLTKLGYLTAQDDTFVLNMTQEIPAS